MLEKGRRGRKGSASPIFRSLDYMGDVVASEIDVADTSVVPGAVVGTAFPQWVVLPVFEVSEPGYGSAVASNVVFCFLPKLSHEVASALNGN